MILAETADPGQQSEGLAKVFGYLLRLEFPTRAEFVDGLDSPGTLYAVLLALTGAVYLLCGFKYFKALVVVNGAVIGALVGAYLGSFRESPNMPLLMGLAGAAMLGIVAWPAIKYAVGLMGAIAGGLIGFGLWNGIVNALGRDSLLPHAWAGGIIGMVALGMLTFVAFRPTVMIFTSVQGSIMIISGICSLLLAHSSIRESMRPELIENDFLLIILIAVPAVAGFAVQFSAETAKIQKKRKATEKPPV
jgi:hypothetical protein